MIKWFKKVWCYFMHSSKCKEGRECWDCKCIDCGREWLEYF